MNIQKHDVTLHALSLLMILGGMLGMLISLISIFEATVTSLVLTAMSGTAILSGLGIIILVAVDRAYCKLNELVTEIKCGKN